MKGSFSFLKALKEKGVKLYMASGTDKEDVINEAQATRGMQTCLMEAYMVLKMTLKNTLKN